MSKTPIKRALFSVSDKTGIVEFAKQLVELNIEIISTGGTSELLREASIPHQQVEDITGLPEMLDGRVKTLHPKIHGGILGRRDKHHDEAMTHQIGWIDLVVVNFYPFADVLQKHHDQGKALTFEQAVEYIDIGGPTLARAAAKNCAWVTVVVDPKDYATVLSELHYHQGIDDDMRKSLALKVFDVTSHYDTVIHDYFLGKRTAHQGYPETLHFDLEKQLELRYGENPHQKACAYQFKQQRGLLSAHQYQGKPLSYNNILDADAALCCVREFAAPAACIIKHMNPCGVATAANILSAYQKAHAADPISSYGGITALNRPCTKQVAEVIAATFMEVVIAPAYTEEALLVLQSKPNLRVLEMQVMNENALEMKFIQGGVLLQDKDQHALTRDDLQIVTDEKPTDEALNAMFFAWRVIKHVKSNAIVIANEEATLGIGAGQVSRIDAVDLAIRKATASLTQAVLASDAFFPFRDSIDRLSGTGIQAIIQPGGSLRDNEVIDACNQYKIAMAFTGKRCFKH